MERPSRLDQIHARVRGNVWFHRFALFNRLALAAGFIPSGMVKILGERFTSLAVTHPMGSYLEALYHTGYYYPFIGVIQVSAALLLLFPRTATLGALLYFPIILNICILSFAVRFDGSRLTSPLMVLANLYLLGWDYHKLKYVLPFRHPELRSAFPSRKDLGRIFPWKFFAGVAATVLAVALVAMHSFDLVPRNTPGECRQQCAENSDQAACLEFCDCIHEKGHPLDNCLEVYHRSSAGSSTDLP